VLTTRKARILLALVIAVWLAAGLFGREPWKPDEAYSFGLVTHIMKSGDWVVPTLAGEPFMEKPPVFFISAALFAQAFHALLSLPDAARLACAFYAGLTLLFVWLATRALYGREAALAAVLLLMGCVGYFHTAHLLVTDNALIAGVAIALYGLAVHAQRPVAGGIALGTGTGLAFLAKGLLGPGMIGLTALALLAAPGWRTRAYLRTLAIAAAALTPWALIWPSALYQRSPALFHDWLVVNNLGRFTGTADLGPEHDHLMYAKILPLFALPVLPLALWNAWRALRRRDARIVMPVAASAVMFAVLSSACNARYVYALPMLVPLALAAGPCVNELPSIAARACRWLAIAPAAAAALILWVGWGALILDWPAGAVQALLAFRPRFTPAFQPWLALSALAATIGAVVALRAARGTWLAWSLAATLPWTLFFTLWLAYADYGNSYRGLIAELASRLPAGTYCVANRGLGEPQRAMLEYYAGIVTRAEASVDGKYCQLLLVQQSANEPLPAHERAWLALWSGARPGDVNERFWLFGSAQLAQQAERQKVNVSAVRRRRVAAGS